MTEASDIRIDRVESAVSAIVPVYNVEKYLARCVDSLLNQSLPFQEIILIDDGSTDSSGAICDLYKDKSEIIKVIHQENNGLGGARNTGIGVAQGEYLTFIDSDDWVSPVFNEILFKGASATDADIAVGTMVRADSSFEFPLLQDELCEYHTFSSDEYMDVFLRIHSNRCVHYACGKLYRSDIIELNHFPEGLLNEDVEGFFKSLTNSKKVVEVTKPAPLYCYYCNAESITGGKFGPNYLTLPEVWERVYELAESRRPDLLQEVKYNQNRVWFTLLCDSIVHGDAHTDLRYKKEIELCRVKNKAHFFELLQSPMVIRRKALLIAITLFYLPIKLWWRKCRTNC